MSNKTSGTLVIIDGKNPLSDAGGFQTYAYNLGKLTTELGYDVHIFCFADKTAVVKTNIGTIHTLRSRLYELHFLKSVELAGLAFLAPMLAGTILKELDSRPTILWGIGPWSLAGVFVRLLSKNRNIKLLSYYPTTFKHEFSGTLSSVSLSDHGLFAVMQVRLAAALVIPIYTLFERMIMSVSDKIVNHYQSAEQILSAQFHVDKTKYVRIPYYVNVVQKVRHHGKEREVKLSRPLVTLICRHDGRKGINYLIHAFELLNQRRVKFHAIIVGGGKLLEPHRRLTRRLRLTNVALPGFLADTRRILKKTDVYVFPSVEEGSSAISVLEAMKYGLPLVTTAVDGIVEDVEDGTSALLVPPHDPDALADALERLLTDVPLARRLRLGAKKRFAADHGRMRVKAALKTFLHREFALLSR